MNDMQAAPRATVGARPPAWIELLGALLRPWLRIRREPADAARLVPDDDTPTVYIVERYGLSDTLILEQACRDAGLPSPYAIASKLPIKRRSAVVSLSRRPRLFARRPHPSRSETLTKLAEAINADTASDVRLVPVSIFVGRAPDRESGWFSVLFSENWVVVGRFRRLLALLFMGRDTIVQFAPPVSMREAIATEEPARGVRKLQRLLRVHFRRIRAVVIGPDLSHRRTVVDALLNADPVRSAIDAVASKENIDREKARQRARKYALEIAADYSHPVVRSLQFMLKTFWNKLYDGVDVHHFDTIRKVAPGHEIIYVPCHRSHVDYLLLSYQLLTHHVAIPHIGAGINLNMPVIGPILRRGSAFFLRRTFKGDPLYSTVFREYISQLFARGVSLEYFIEGGRSRTGRLLSPRGGMLSMTLRSFLRESRRPVVFQPVYIGYEKIMEGDAYIGELSGKPKEKESLLGFFRAFGALRQHYGRVALNFGEPIFLRPLLDDVAPGWETATADPEAKPEWLNRAVDSLATRILENVNRAAHVNPINLLALSLLATPKHAMTEADLAAQIELFKALLIELPYSDRVTMTELSPAQIIAYGEKMGWIRRTAHPLGDVLGVDDKEGVLLSYFRNNVTHLYAAAAWLACCFLNNRRMARASILRLGRLVYPFIQAELFLPWSDEEFAARIQQTIDLFIARGLLGTDADGRVITRQAGQSDSAFRLRALARNLLPAIERYYIGVALLVKNGPHTLSAGELETLCWLTAQRLSLLHELNAPEFFDRSLFRGFIQKLRERRVIWADENGKLVFDTQLNAVAQHARVILSREIRHGILKLTPEKQAELTRSADDASTDA
jgi:glycerol-3-phosphate O-acyltransferase